MAKSITTLLTQIAIQKQILPSWEAKVLDYLPELQGAYNQDLELKHLADMTAGLNWNEHYKNPFDITAQAYYGDDIKKLITEKVQVINPPGEKYEYQSGATEILGLCLRAATAKSLSELASEWLWVPLGAQEPASWHLDHKRGVELAYCCFNSNAQDFARLGQLLLDNGKWNNEIIVDSSFIAEATSPGLVPYYGRSFWLMNHPNTPQCYYYRGILGQYIAVVPSENLVFVRLGHQRLDKREDEHPEDIHVYLRETLKVFGK